MNYEAELIKTAYKFGYNVETALREYTALEIKYSPQHKIFLPDNDIKERALKEMQDKILQEYTKVN
jgi:hypothetical protein